MAAWKIAHGDDERGGLGARAARLGARLLSTALIVLVAISIAPARGGAAPTEGPKWTRTLEVGLTARDLGVPRSASARDLARSALERKARRLGLDDAVGDLELASRVRTPAAHGARAILQLRFQQTVGGVRVLWSQLDVTIVSRTVSSIGATVVPLRGGAQRREPQVGAEQALQIARDAVEGDEEALAPLPVAYAGAPTTDRSAKRRRARRAWVIETTPASELAVGEPGGTDTFSSPLCIVVDAQTGEVLARWHGLADRPDRGPLARGGQAAQPPAPPSGGAAQASWLPYNSPPYRLLEIWDGGENAVDQVRPFDGADAHATYAIGGNPRVGANWPAYQTAAPFSRQCTSYLSPLPCVQMHEAPQTEIDVVAINARDVAFTLCARYNFCGRIPGLYFPWRVIVTGEGGRTWAPPVPRVVEIRADDGMDGTCPAAFQCGTAPFDPKQPDNDIIAHEFGHLMDFVYAGDRNFDGQTLVAREVQEGLADMFAYDYDRADPTFGEQAGTIRIRWDDPPSYCPWGHGICFPDHMRDYDPTPPDGDIHFNSTILSHAYYLFVQRVRHGVAGRVLQRVPSYLSPSPTFQQVRNGFVARAAQLYPADGPDSGTTSDVGQQAARAFDEVGLHGSAGWGGICGLCL